MLLVGFYGGCLVFPRRGFHRIEQGFHWFFFRGCGSMGLNGELMGLNGFLMVF